MENFEIKSNLLREKWDSINTVYYSLKEELSKNKSGIEFDQLYDFLLEEWRNIYPSFVLHPIKEKILNLFFQAQTTDFKLKTPTRDKTKVYSVHYYLLQYFSIGIIPHHDYESFPDIRLKSSESGDPNLILYEIFEEICSELGLDSITEDDLFYDSSEFYQIEVELLSDFLSKCWNETKSKTKLNVKGILFESTGADTDYNLDKNKKIE
ncbi:MULTISPECIES: hypothetical protein [Tenacibaculum]|uniref:hypothetical protein n=1 Tax=Tenacibaculum TaxID=104267 RepID=UPI000F5B2B52|nr:hypothetical protein [Tenacibaculum discolor]